MRKFDFDLLKSTNFIDAENNQPTKQSNKENSNENERRKNEASFSDH